jgi:hypothetical protein
MNNTVRNSSMPERDITVRSWDNGESFIAATDNIPQNSDHHCQQNGKVWVCAGSDYKWLIYQSLSGRKQMHCCCLRSQLWASILKRLLRCYREWVCAWSASAEKSTMVIDTHCLSFLLAPTEKIPEQICKSAHQMGWWTSRMLQALSPSICCTLL